MRMLRVLLVAEDLLVRTGLASLFANMDGVRVVGQSSGERIADELDVFRPDVVLWDMGWNDHAIARLSGLAGVSVLALIGDPTLAVRIVPTLEHSAYGILPRDSHPDLLAQALMSVGAGLVVLTPALTEALRTPALPAASALLEELTPRERAVLDLLAQGLTNKAIALRLSITDHTVKFHVNAIMTKLDAQSRTDAVIRATRAGIVIL